jgi:hypothetical protein
MTSRKPCVSAIGLASDGGQYRGKMRRQGLLKQSAFTTLSHVARQRWVPMVETMCRFRRRLRRSDVVWDFEYGQPGTVSTSERRS